MKLGFSPAIRAIYNTQKHIHPIPVSPTDVLQTSRLIFNECNVNQKESMLLQDARELHSALIIRMSRALEMIRHIPQAPQSQELQKLVSDHATWFNTVCSSPLPVDEVSHKAFLNVLDALQYPSGQEILKIFATIGRQFADMGPSSYVQGALQSLCRRRMIWQLMVANHVALSNGTSAGIFSDTIRPLQIVQSCAHTVGHLCTQSLGSQPHFLITGDSNAVLTHVEPNISYLISELLKNAARATTVHHNELVSRKERVLTDQLPPIEVVVSSSDPSSFGPPTVRVSITDKGGGIPNDLEVAIWDFGSTTAVIEPSQIAPIAGFGIGLPLSKLFAQQFGGSLKLKSSANGCSAIFEHPVRGKEMFFMDTSRIPFDDDV